MKDSIDTIRAVTEGNCSSSSVKNKTHINRKLTAEKEASSSQTALEGHHAFQPHNNGGNKGEIDPNKTVKGSILVHDTHTTIVIVSVVHSTSKTSLSPVLVT